MNKYTEKKKSIDLELLLCIRGNVYNKTNLQRIDDLIRRGANVNVIDVGLTMTPLMWAVMKKDKDLVDMLIDRGASIDDLQPGYGPKKIAGIVGFSHRLINNK